MTIAAYILSCRVASHTDRLERLVGLLAPEMVLDRERELLARAQDGRIGPVSAPKTGEPAETLLALDYTEVKWAKGRGGHHFATFTTASGPVNYFPQAKFGPFIAR